MHRKIKEALQKNMLFLGIAVAIIALWGIFSVFSGSDEMIETGLPTGNVVVEVEESQVLEEVVVDTETSQQKLIEAYKELSDLKGEARDLKGSRNSNDNYEEEMADLIKEENEIREEIESYEQLLDAQKAYKDLKTELEEQDYDDYYEEISEKGERRMELDMEIINKQNELQSLLSDLELLEDSDDNLIQDAEEVNAEIKDLESERSSLRYDESDLRIKQVSEERSISVIKNKIKLYEEIMELIEEKISMQEKSAAPSDIAVIDDEIEIKYNELDSL